MLPRRISSTLKAKRRKTVPNRPQSQPSPHCLFRCGFTFTPVVILVSSNRIKVLTLAINLVKDMYHSLPCKDFKALLREIKEELNACMLIRTMLLGCQS